MKRSGWADYHFWLSCVRATGMGVRNRPPCKSKWFINHGHFLPRYACIHCVGKNFIWRDSNERKKGRILPERLIVCHVRTYEYAFCCWTSSSLLGMPFFLTRTKTIGMIERWITNWLTACVDKADRLCAGKYCNLSAGKSLRAKI